MKDARRDKRTEASMPCLQCYCQLRWRERNARWTKKTARTSERKCKLLLLVQSSHAIVIESSGAKFITCHLIVSCWGAVERIEWRREGEREKNLCTLEQRRSSVSRVSSSSLVSSFQFHLSCSDGRWICKWADCTSTTSKCSQQLREAWMSNVFSVTCSHCTLLLYSHSIFHLSSSCEDGEGEKKSSSHRVICLFSPRQHSSEWEWKKVLATEKSEKKEQKLLNNLVRQLMSDISSSHWLTHSLEVFASKYTRRDVRSEKWRIVFFRTKYIVLASK